MTVTFGVTSGVGLRLRLQQPLWLGIRLGLSATIGATVTAGVTCTAEGADAVRAVTVGGTVTVTVEVGTVTTVGLLALRFPFRLGLRFAVTERLRL